MGTCLAGDACVHRRRERGRSRATHDHLTAKMDGYSHLIGWAACQRHIKLLVAPHHDDGDGAARRS